MSQAFSSPSRRGLVGLAVAGLVAALCLLLIPGGPDSAKGQGEPTANAAKKKKKKKKKDTVKVASYNLYLGSDTDETRDAALSSRTDLFADDVGEIYRNVNANDFNVRAATIAKVIKKNKVDLVGLQEATLWRLEIPTDGGGPPRGSSAQVPLIDYIDTLLNELNKKARTKKQCNTAAKKRKAQGKKPKPCFQGYRLVGSQQNNDPEFPGDFDNDPGPDGKTFDMSDAAAQAALGAAAPSRWLDGNDDTPGINLAEPPATQCSDGIDNDGDGLVDYGPTAGVNETSGPSAGDTTPATGIQGGGPPWGCDSRLSGNELANAAPGADTSLFPQDANFDHHLFSGNFPSADNGTPPCPGFPAPSANCPTGVSFDSAGNGLDAPGVNDCTPPVGQATPKDTSPDRGPAFGAGQGAWQFSGYDGDIDPDEPGFQMEVCLFHGIDGDLRLTDRDVLLARKGAGVKTRNVRGGNFSSTLAFDLLGQSVPSTRGWVSADVSVRGKKFRLVNTHLEDEQAGTFREDQASELVAPGGPAATTPVVLVGDLNSDPSIVPGADPEADGLSNVAYNRLAAAGFRSLTGAAPTHGHGELLNDLGNLIDDSRIDHILTNSPSIRLGSSVRLDPVGGGLWASDHAGLLSRLRVPGGKKK